MISQFKHENRIPLFLFITKCHILIYKVVVINSSSVLVVLILLWPVFELVFVGDPLDFGRDFQQVLFTLYNVLLFVTKAIKMKNPER